MLDKTNQYWRFEPTIEKTLSLNTDQSTRAANLYGELKQSDRYTTLAQLSNKFLQHVSRRGKTTTQTENISEGIEALKDVFGIYELGFPLPPRHETYPRRRNSKHGQSSKSPRLEGSP